MRINRNLKSITKASAKFANHQYPVKSIYDFEKAIVKMDLEKNIFSITYLESSSQDDDDDDSLFYQASETEHFGLDRTDLMSIVRFHVGLVLPKEKSVVVRQIARNVVKSMSNTHAYTYVGWYGHSQEYSQYVMPIDEFVNLVAAAVIPSTDKELCEV